MSLVRQIVSVLSSQCVIHIIGYILMMQMFFFNFDFDSGSRAHFRSETFQRFIYFNNIQHYVLSEVDCQCTFELVCHSHNWIYLNDADVFLQFRFCSGFQSSFPFRNTPEIHLFLYYSTLCPYGGRLLVTFELVV